MQNDARSNLGEFQPSRFQSHGSWNQIWYGPRESREFPGKINIFEISKLVFIKQIIFGSRSSRTFPHWFVSIGAAVTLSVLLSKSTYFIKYASNKVGFNLNRFNYKIGDVFRELMGCTQPGYVARTDMSNGSREKGRCTIL